MVNRLRDLVEAHQIQLIQIFRFADSKFYHESTQWRFGYEFLELGDQPYNLNRVVTFKIVGQTLQLYL